MVANPIEWALRSSERREIKNINKVVDVIESLEDIYKDLTDEELKAQTENFKKRIEEGETTDHLLPEAFAVSREACRRVLGKFPYPVQMMGGVVLHRGNIAEMGTGEGKALTVSTRIPTPNGFRRAGSLKVGEEVFGSNGEPTRLLGVFPQGQQEVWTLKTINGQKVDCNSSHLWEVVIGRDRVRATLTTEQIKELLEQEEAVGLLHLEGPVQYSYKSNLPVPPYSLGSALRHDSIIATIPISDSYKQGSVEQRLDLLKGFFMANPEFVSPESGSIHIRTGNGSLVGDIFEIMASLGIRVYEREWYPHFKETQSYGVTPVYEMDANAYGDHRLNCSEEVTESYMDDLLHCLMTEMEITEGVNNGNLVTEVIKTGRLEEQVCFKVAANDSLFLVEDYLVTHNTITAVAPVYLNALEGKGAHVVTVNEYLAETQAEQMGRVYSFLGLTSDVILSHYQNDRRREAYRADITYGTNNEMGFDYLRDNMAKSLSEKVQRGHHYVIVDEADSILIDEARTPLIISGGQGYDDSRWHRLFAELVKPMKNHIDYKIDEKDMTVDILDPAYDKVENHLGIKSLFNEESSGLLSILMNSVRAKELYHKDKDYVIRDGEAMLVDEHTGRVMDGRRFSEGLHQALEAKEGLDIQKETVTTATITLQNYFKLYDKISGMTGTAQSEASEMMSTYGVNVVPIPPNKEKIRIDQEDSMFVSDDDKYEAIIKDIKERHKTGQPILVGTSSVVKSEIVSGLLRKEGIPHNVLNAKDQAKEAAIIAYAGRKGSVTVATNMAGRGTDILLGGNPEFTAEEEVRNSGIDPDLEPDKFNQLYKDLLEKHEKEVEESKEEVKALGGLYVIGTERHNSRRIDDQLKGRSGRQGDPGESKFYLSLDDEVLRLFGPSMVQTLKNTTPAGTEISSKIITKIVESAQSKISSRDAEARKNVVKYDDVLNRQREVIYRERDMVMGSENPVKIIESLMVSSIEDVFKDHLNRNKIQDEIDTNALWEELNDIYPVLLTQDDIEEEFGHKSSWDIEEVQQEFIKDAKMELEAVVKRLGENLSASFARESILTLMDKEWPIQLSTLDYIRAGIGLRSLAQKDPLVEYQRESTLIYEEMMKNVRGGASRMFFSISRNSLGDSLKNLVTKEGVKALMEEGE